MVKKRIYFILSLLASSFINSFLEAVSALVGRPSCLFISTADYVALEVEVEATDSSIEVLYLLEMPNLTNFHK